MPTEEGTAQGSVIGPTEYLFYCNDMCNIFREASVYQFADDTCLLVADKNLDTVQNIMQINFDLLCKWAHDVGLIINYDKTKYIHIHSSHNKSVIQPTIQAHSHLCLHHRSSTIRETSRYYCNCNNLESVSQHTYLGLIIDDKFNWKPHVEYVCKKLRAVLSKLSLLKYKLPYNIMRMLYNALADSIIGYGLSSYGRTYKTYIENIYKLQLRLLKTIVPNSVKNKYKNDYSNLFKHCRIIDIYNKIKMYVICDEIENSSLLKLRIRNSNLRNLIYLPKYVLPSYNNTYGKRCSIFMLPSLLNELQKDLLDEILDNPEQCKRQLKTFYLSMCQ